MKKILLILLLSFLLGLIFLFLVEHLGSFTYELEKGNTHSKSRIESIIYKTPFNSEVKVLSKNKFTVDAAFNEDSELKTYTFQLPFYLKALWKDLYIAVAVMLLLFLFLRRRIKIERTK
ncbi:hypothetical protein SAMN05216480_11854 [Pustulibacterium marinum]|uniref:Uncharacterized protein n=1 Tax=Pustulibacterium marinum TaxID=1224947 RepID=A0A1I7INQ1_9FLAO|nr:hypothetical protein [Pustulibacterium marinum]SFU74544.1 hypothetical protein SAMN05216480_11854 [Pustulibacterium marinum]